MLLPAGSSPPSRHGAFFGIGSVRRRRLVAPDKQAGAIAMMFAGLTPANVLGVPFGTLARPAAGLARDVLGASPSIGVARAGRHRGPRPGRRPGHEPVVHGTRRDLRGELAAFRYRPGLALARGDRPRLRRDVRRLHVHRLHADRGHRLRASAVPWLLILFGVGLFAGNLLGGRRPTVPWLAPCSSCYARARGRARRPSRCCGQPGGDRQPALVLMGGFGFATVPGLQMRVIGYAAGAPTLASGANIAAFNVGNALGAWTRA